ANNAAMSPMASGATSAYSCRIYSHTSSHARCAPSPLVGEGWGGGWQCCARCAKRPPPPLTPAHKGEGNRPSVSYAQCTNLTGTCISPRVGFVFTSTNLPTSFARLGSFSQVPLGSFPHEPPRAALNGFTMSNSPTHPR